MEKCRRNEILVQQYRYSPWSTYLSCESSSLVLFIRSELSEGSVVFAVKFCLHKQRLPVAQWCYPTRDIFKWSLHRILAFPRIGLHLGDSLVWWAISATRRSLREFLSLANAEDDALLWRKSIINKWMGIWRLRRMEEISGVKRWPITFPFPFLFPFPHCNQSDIP